jgi:hypothetical protein
MPGFKNTIPQPNDDLSVSQGDLLLNFQSCNTSFGIDHYPFTDLTANDGKHNKVTTPVITPNAYPTTLANEPVLFCFKESMVGSTAAFPAMQYVQGGSNAVPSPIMTIQSPLTPITLAANATTNIIDFTGLTNCQFVVYSAPINSTNAQAGLSINSGLFWKIAGVRTIKVLPMTSQAGTIQDGGNGILQLKNTSGGSLDYVWTLQIIRISQ